MYNLTKNKISKFSDDNKKMTSGVIYLKLAGRVFRVVTNRADTYITIVKKPKKKTTTKKLNYTYM